MTVADHCVERFHRGLHPSSSPLYAGAAAERFVAASRAIAARVGSSTG